MSRRPALHVHALAALGVATLGLVLHALTRFALIDGARPGSALLIAAFALWLAGEVPAALKREEFYLPGALPRVRRFRQPLLFATLLSVQLVVALVLLYGAARVLVGA